MNEALQTVDSVVAAAVAEPPTSTVPSSPAVGTCYIVGDTPTGEWAGHEHSLATFTGGGWRFISPFEGLSVYVSSTGLTAAYRGGAWTLGQLVGSVLVLDGQQVVGARAPSIGSAAGGTVVDTQARAVIDQILATLRQHGLIDS